MATKVDQVNGEFLLRKFGCWEVKSYTLEKVTSVYLWYRDRPIAPLHKGIATRCLHVGGDSYVLIGDETFKWLEEWGESLC